MSKGVLREQGVRKKATDVILDIDKKLNDLINYTKNLDHNIKIILARLNESSQNQVISPQPEVKTTEEKKPAEPNVPKIKSVNVSQQVIYKDGRHIFLADVEIRDEAGKKLIKQTRTNVKGKWIAALAPGNYIIKVSKKVEADPSRPIINASYIY